MSYYHAMFLSQWSSQKTQSQPVHHGEKLLHTNSDHEYLMNNNYGITNLEMEKQRLLDIDIESLELECVNPYEVNPINQPNTSQQIASAHVQNSPSVSQQQNCPQISGGVSYNTREKKIKLEMEEFGDLSDYLHPKRKPQNSVDELNTPIFDKNLPGYDLNFDNFQSDQQFIKLESQSSYGNNLISNNIFKNNNIDIKKMNNNNEYIISSEFDTILLPNSVTSNVSPGSDNGRVYYDQLNLRSYDISGISYSLEQQGALSLNTKTENSYSNVSSPAVDVQQLHSGVSTPDGSVCSSNCPTPKLTLNVNVKPTDTVLATPSIIEDVVEMEKFNFNILEYIQNEAICETINVEDLLESTNGKHILSGKELRKSQLQPSHNKRSRKRRLSGDDDDDDDEDEDYVPPGAKQASKKRLVVECESDSDDGDDEVDVVKRKGKTRGRPPKRTGSVSSDCSKDSDVSKYRELRDKNNEASRKSRLKRKIKEQELESEADELYSRNIKLKAQVEELEKLVTKFREDLFKIMIRK